MLPSIQFINFFLYPPQRFTNMAAQTACDAAALFSPKQSKITIPFLLAVLRHALSATASHGDCVFMGEQHLLATPDIRGHVFALKGLAYAALLH